MSPPASQTNTLLKSVASDHWTQLFCSCFHQTSSSPWEHIVRPQKYLLCSLPPLKEYYFLSAVAKFRATTACSLTRNWQLGPCFIFTVLFHLQLINTFIYSQYHLRYLVFCFILFLSLLCFKNRRCVSKKEHLGTS